MSLVRVPEHQLMESPASWMTRLALSQLLTVKELRQYCGIGTATDLDISFRTKSFESVATSLGQVSGSLAPVDTVLRTLQVLDPTGRRFLLSHGNAPQYRFCQVCLARDKVKYFRLGWRFKRSLWCPLHMCLLCDACPVCRKPIRLPNDLINAGRMGSGVATLDRCLACEALLTKDADSMEGTLDFTKLADWQDRLLREGRVVVDAMLQGRYTTQAEHPLVHKSAKGSDSLQRQLLIPRISDMLKLL